MPEDNQNPPLPTAEEVAQKNADVARQLANQDINAHSTAGNPNESASSALDALAAEVNKKHDEEPTAEQKAAADKEAADKAKAAADKAAADKAAADKDAADKGQTPPEKIVEEDIAKRSTELFKDTAQLPPGASPKSSEAFNAIKTKAAQEVITRDRKILELEAAVKERDEKLKNPVPPELHKELEDLRSFRAKLDVEADPQFKAFDKTIASSQEFIYAQLKKSPAVTDELIAQIKKIGGPEMCDLDKVWAAVKDPTLQRIVESRIAEIEQAKWAREEAIKTTKANVSDYVKKREEEFVKSATAHNDATKTELTAFVKQMPWFAPRVADSKADDATKKAVEDHNKFVKETQAQLQAALEDDSPKMRAIMLAATAQLLNLQRVHAGVSAKLTATEKSLAEATEKLDKLKNASVSRLRESGASTIKTTVNAKTDNFSTPAGDALDTLAKQVVEERARAKSGQ
jgi:hypothetical protein